MKSTIPPHHQEILELLEGLARFKSEYPPELLAARRAAFIAQIEQHKTAGVSKEEYLAKDRMIELLESLKPVVAEYPPELLEARRAAFIGQIEQHNSVDFEDASQDQVIELLGHLKQPADEYPPALIASRRAAFLTQIKQHNEGLEQQELLPALNGRLSKLLGQLKSIEIEYPLKLWTARRSAFVGQIRYGGTSVLDTLRTAIRNLFGSRNHTPFAPVTPFRRTSMIIATLLVVTFIGSVLYNNSQPLSELSGSSLSREGSHSEQVDLTSTSEVSPVICKPGYLPPLCLAKEFDKSRDLTFPGNGVARPAVAKDTIPGYTRIHQPAYVNDGLYGPGASWISNSAYSWIKIDLGEAKTINTITFGRDRLGQFNDGDPGQFVIAVALADNIYADGNSSNDYMEYEKVYDSDEMGFDGIVSGPETIQASFEPVTARYVKITFENAKTAVDEIEVFMIQPTGFVESPTRRPRDEQPQATFTPVPTNTLVPSPTATNVPTRTPVPTYTSTPRPTSTPLPTITNTPRPPNTPTDLPPTNTPIPVPTDTREPVDTDTPVPVPTDTPEPAPTSTPGVSAFSTLATMEIFGP